MTRQRIADGLMLLVLALSNAIPVLDPPDGWQPYEWAYVKGLASSEILRLQRVVAAE